MAPLKDINAASSKRSSARRAGKENGLNASSKQHGQAKQTRKRRPALTGIDKQIQDSGIKSIAETVLKEREDSGSADVATKIKSFNSAVGERLQISRHQINSYINNKKRMKAKDQNNSSNDTRTARSVVTPPLPPLPCPPSVQDQPATLPRLPDPPLTDQVRLEPPRPEGLPENYQRCAAGDRCSMTGNNYPYGTMVVRQRELSLHTELPREESSSSWLLVACLLLAVVGTGEGVSHRSPSPERVEKAGINLLIRCVMKGTW